MIENRGNIIIRTHAVVTAVALVTALYIASTMPDVLVVSFVCLILAAAITPYVRALQARLKCSRGVATSLVFGLLLTICGLLGWLLVPSLIQQMNDLTTQIPKLAAQLRETYAWLQHMQGTYDFLPRLEEAAGSLSSFAASWLASSLGMAGQAMNVLGTVSLVLIGSFFLILESKELRRGAIALVPVQHRATFDAQIDPIAEKMGAYVRGIGITIGFLMLYLGVTLTLAGVPMSLALTMAAGIMEIIPMVGSLLGVIPAFIIALTVSWKLAVAVLGIFLVGNFIQGNFVHPWVMSKSVDVSPVMVMLALLIGAKLMGMAGALIAVPVLAAIHVLIENLYIAPMEARATRTLLDAKSGDMRLEAMGEGSPRVTILAEGKDSTSTSPVEDEPIE